MSIFNKINQRVLMMARRREIADGEPGLAGSLQCDPDGNLYTSLVALGPLGPLAITAISPPDGTPIDPAGDTALEVAALNYVFDSGTGDWLPQESDNPTVVNWTATNAPATNVIATATRAAQGALTRNVVNAIAASLTGSAASAADLRVRLRNGAGGTILFEQAINISSVTGTASFTISGLEIETSVNTAAVLEFSAAGGAATFESVFMSGVTVAT